MSKRVVILCACGFVAGALAGDFFGRFRTANHRALGELYPAALGQNIRKDARVLDLLNRNEVEMATKLLRQNIEINLSSLHGLKGTIPIGQTQEDALAMGKEVLAATSKENTP